MYHWKQGYLPLEARGAVAHALSILLNAIYCIRLEWEPHGIRYVWGEGSIGVEALGVSLGRKGIFIDDFPLDDFEWDK